MGVAAQRGEFDTFSSPSANDSSRMELEFFESSGSVQAVLLGHFVWASRLEALA